MLCITYHLNKQLNLILLIIKMIYVLGWEQTSMSWKQAVTLHWQYYNVAQPGSFPS